MKTLPAARLTETVRDLYIKANRSLPADVERRIRYWRDRETWPAARAVLDEIIENFELASRKQVPVCQDTGMACVFIELGSGVYIDGNIEEAVDGGVRQACAQGPLRASVVEDPLRRRNTGDNTPALVTVSFPRNIGADVCRVVVAPKGFGSENMSRVVMLKPSDGREGVVDFVVDTVRSAGPNPCPPVVAGVGIGGSFDKAALMAKKALLRPLDESNSDCFYADLESELLEKINALGIGPAGYGGLVTCLGVSVEAMATHIAGLPCAVNISCHVTRRAEAYL